MSDISTKHVEAISWVDMEALINQKVEESQYLEFKSGALSKAPNGKHVARDAACKAVVAFANAYGGTFILGIDEASGVASSITHPIADINAYAESFERSIRSMIDPPIAGMQFRTLDGGNGSGVLLIRVPTSIASPHGFGTPPEAYVRVGKNSRPMTMRDLQSLFWDARTRRERVAAIRADFCADFETLRQHFLRSELREQGGSVVSATDSRLFFRVSAIAQERVPVGQMPLDQWRYSLRPSTNALKINAMAAFGEGSFGNNFRRIAHGVAEVDANYRWTILDDGIVSVIGSRRGAPIESKQNHHSPHWYVTVVAQVLVMADRIRRQAGVADAAYEIDCEIAVANGVLASTQSDHGFGGRHSPSLEYAKIGPFLMEGRETVPSSLAALESEVWGFFGLTPKPSLEINWQAAWQ